MYGAALHQPNGFDCSGLTYYVLGQLGISIERTADLQYHRQEAIGLKDLLPGDLVFFAWHGGDAEHVGYLYWQWEVY